MDENSREQIKDTFWTMHQIEYEIEEIEVIPDSICLHGDNPKAVLFSQKIRAALEAEGVTVVSMKEILA